MNSPVSLKDSAADQETEWLSIMRVAFERKDDADRFVLFENAESSGDFEKEPGQTFVLQWKYSRASGEILVVVPGLATISARSMTAMEEAWIGSDRQELERADGPTYPAS